MSKVGHNRIQLGDDSDPNKNFVIGTPSPNNGTLEVRKGTIEEPGDLVARFTDSATSAGDLVKFEQVFGVGQTRQDMTEFRASDVTYTNTGTKPIKIILTGVSTAAGQYFRLRNGELTVTYGIFWASTTGNFTSGEVTILPGETYRLDTTIPLGWKWLEIR